MLTKSKHSIVGLLIFMVLALAGVTSGLAQDAAASLDVDAATRAYLDQMSAQQKARSDAYFEGGYWLQLWNFLLGLGVAWLLLGTRLSARIRDFVEKTTRLKPFQTLIYWAAYLVVTTVIFFPYTVYTNLFREQQYGLSNQTFGPWFSEFMIGFMLNIVLVGLLLIAIYGVIRKARQTWWMWASGVSIMFLMFIMIIGPVFISPLFNTYTPLEEGPVRSAILSMARANGVPATEVYQYDASRQGTRIGANVSGFMGTMRISLNDNLLNRSDLDEIKSVMGHEIGHYVLNHVYEGLILIGLLITGGFAFLRWGFDWALGRWGAQWGIRDIGDVAGLPLIVAVFSVYFFVMTPVTNTITRSNEAEADQFGLNAAREPDGFAKAALKLGEYRKMEPGALEEFLFFDHPSGRNRIMRSMIWKVENLE